MWTHPTFVHECCWHAWDHALGASYVRGLWVVRSALFEVPTSKSGYRSVRIVRTILWSAHVLHLDYKMLEERFFISANGVRTWWQVETNSKIGDSCVGILERKQSTLLYILYFFSWTCASLSGLQSCMIATCWRQFATQMLMRSWNAEKVLRLLSVVALFSKWGSRWVTRSDHRIGILPSKQDSLTAPPGAEHDRIYFDRNFSESPRGSKLPDRIEHDRIANTQSVCLKIIFHPVVITWRMICCKKFTPGRCYYNS